MFCQAEDGIRDVAVTGVQTCALPISTEPSSRRNVMPVRRILITGAGSGIGAGLAAILSRAGHHAVVRDRKSTRLNSSHGYISYAVFCLKKKKRKPSIS